MVAYERALDKLFYVITQNALADTSYAAYEKGDPRNAGIWLPAKEDNAKAFQQYITDIKEERIKAGADVKTENGKVQVQGVAGVMKINAIITKKIFENNIEREFFVEESYVLPWMFPQLMGGNSAFICAICGLELSRHWNNLPRSCTLLERAGS